MGAAVGGALFDYTKNPKECVGVTPVEDKKSYPIGYVALTTGLSPHVIRVWEKRYGAVTPERTGKSRRLYSQRDIDHLKLLKAARSKGQRIGTAVKLDEEALYRMGRHEKQPTDSAKSIFEELKCIADSSELLDACLEAVRRMDASALTSGLRRAGAHLSRPSLLNGVIAPLMQRVGDGWADGSLRIMHEHFASNVVKGFLWEMIRSAPTQVHASAMVVTTPAGQLCEIGAMMTAVTAADCGWNALYFGPSLPAEEIAAAALHARAEAVALSISCSVRADILGRELSFLRQSLGEGVHLIVGGRAAGAFQQAVAAVGGQCFESLYEFSEFIGQQINVIPHLCR
jgi:MerR family transcriptional regulator, light-induced transcriptional regulator